MRILGIDPGSIKCGYGLIEATTPNPSLFYLSSGRIILSARKPLHIRLQELYTSLIDVISEYKPDEIVIEKIFFAKSVRVALSLGHTRGVVLLAASLTGIPIYEYSALEVKKAVVGYGRADKNQVQKLVKEILNIKHLLSSDSADAIALAICHANTKQIQHPSPIYRFTKQI
ncbi:crossover junction endodeoxyribonuclease RuvC [Dissulfurispira thermophila]|uniref:Crossover junction endodeoxyribonuclease RuvC n=2 Tax=root TaxID=1 RepID=A0A7G1H455_9BACT|nr:crossover junction endodeoxyribonuclease RuvC [Dissulfurispira thermophila]BCB96922.1 crossover junction endodeoxyribonuclease RuvC [Dissulfurispira thermophila]